MKDEAELRPDDEVAVFRPGDMVSSSPGFFVVVVVAMTTAPPVVVILASSPRVNEDDIDVDLGDDKFIACKDNNLEGEVDKSRFEEDVIWRRKRIRRQDIRGKRKRTGGSNSLTSNHPRTSERARLMASEK